MVRIKLICTLRSCFERPHPCDHLKKIYSFKTSTKKHGPCRMLVYCRPWYAVITLLTSTYWKFFFSKLRAYQINFWISITYFWIVIKLKIIPYYLVMFYIENDSIKSTTNFASSTVFIPLDWINSMILLSHTKCEILLYVNIWYHALRRWRKFHSNKEVHLQFYRSPYIHITQ